VEPRAARRNFLLQLLFREAKKPFMTRDDSVVIEKKNKWRASLVIIGEMKFFGG
jgi:hypothetical protein